MDTMRAYLGDSALKVALLEELGKHEAADALIRGDYGVAELDVAHFKGCGVGCALHSLNAVRPSSQMSVSDHTRFPRELGIPVELAYLYDHLFESLPDNRTWPRQLLEAIQPGANLSGVVPSLLQWMILDSTHGLIALAKPQFHGTYRGFAALVAQDWATPRSVSVQEWDDIDEALADCQVWARARAWAWARAWAGARAGAWAWTWAGARAWARAWARARAWAWARAWAGARAWAWAGARAGAYGALRDQTLKLISEAPVIITEPVVGSEPQTPNS